MKIKEFIHGAKLKVLRWNENLPAGADHKAVGSGGGSLQPDGILMFRVHDKVQVLRNPSSRYQQIRKAGFSSRNNGVNYPPLIVTSKIVFPIPPFAESTTKQMFFSAISSLICFHRNNHRLLAKQLTEDFLSCFSFNACTALSMRNRNPNHGFKLVLVVDVDRKFVHVLPKSVFLPAPVVPNVSDLCQALSSTLVIKQEIEVEEEETGLRQGMSSALVIKQDEAEAEGYYCFGDELMKNFELWDILEKLRHGWFPSYNQYRRPKRVAPIIGAPRELSQVKAVIKMSSADGKKLEGDDQCSICWEGYCGRKECRRIAVMPCSHIFHRNCAFKWLIDHRSCPLCRRVCKTPI